MPSLFLRDFSVPIFSIKKEMHFLKSSISLEYKVIESLSPINSINLSQSLEFLLIKNSIESILRFNSFKTSK